MSVQPLRKEGDQNPRTAEEAKALVKQVESPFMPWNIDALVAGFTDDCIVRFGTVPEFRGRDALRAFFTARSGKQKGYRLKKSFRAMVNAPSPTSGKANGRTPRTGRRHARLRRRSLDHARR